MGGGVILSATISVTRLTHPETFRAASDWVFRAGQKLVRRHVACSSFKSPTDTSRLSIIHASF